MDIFVEPSIENGKKIVDALNEFGFESLHLSEKHFAEEGTIVQLGYEPVRVDFISELAGVSFHEVWRNKTTGTYGKEKVFFIGLKELIRNKEKTGRKQDLVDLDVLKE